jgi:hypothetical protein
MGFKIHGKLIFNLYISVLISLVYLKTSYAQQPIESEKIAILTPRYIPDKNFNYRDAKYTYQVSWQGIPAANAEITVKTFISAVAVKVLAKSNSVIDIFYKLRYQAEGVLDSKSFNSKQVILTQQENSRKKITEIRFNPKGEIKTIRKQVGKDTIYHSFQTNNQVLDPLGTAFLARSLNWPKGTKRILDAYNGRSRYLITLTSIGEETITIMGQSKKVWVLTPQVWNLNEGQKNKRLRAAKIYITTDNSHDIVRIESEVFVGSVKAELIDIK